MKKPKGIDDAEIYVIDEDEHQATEVNDWDEAVELAEELTMQSESTVVIAKVIATTEYTPARTRTVPA